jgi:hypothetical protein
VYARERVRAAEGGCNFHSSCSGGFQARAISDIGDEDLHANEFARTNYTSLRIGMAHCSLGPNVEPMNCILAFNLNIFVDCSEILTTGVDHQFQPDKFKQWN